MAAIDLRVATFNIRNINDRYEEREPLLHAAFAAMDADVIGLQEVMLEGHDQDDALARRHPHRGYRSFRASTAKAPMFGNVILVAKGEVLAHETLEIGRRRVVQRAMIALPGNRTLWFVNTHLHHKPLEPEARTEQVALLLAWLREAPAADATIITGDFNMPPFEPGYEAMRAAGFRSAMFEANGHEPVVTWPSGIQATTMDTEGDPHCLDYLWLAGSVAVQAARVAANEPADGDSTLYPSDHFALVAEVTVG